MTYITVYFMDENRFLAATEPYEVAVTRTTESENLPLAVLIACFAGPTQQEYYQGLRLLYSGFTHVRKLTIENGIARVYLDGVCANNCAAYSAAGPLRRNLLQFPEITGVKIYDENDPTSTRILRSVLCLTALNRNDFINPKKHNLLGTIYTETAS